MKKIITLSLLTTIIIFFQSSIKGVQFSSVPPTDNTGASGNYCNGCHGSFGLNSGGGAITVNGLPTGNFNSGQAYNFSLSISHGAADRRRWGFSIMAVNGSGQSVGTFSSTNANATLNGSELGHFNAIVTSSQAAYTYNNLRWTAPTNPSNADKNITFYYVGNAANQNGGTSGDYIYAGSTAIVLPIELKRFVATATGNSVLLNWQSSSEINSENYVVERSEDGQVFYTIASIKAAANSNTTKDYSYTDSKPSYFNKPIYYRLKLIDKDNSYKYSAVVNAQLKSSGTMVKNVYPSLIRSLAPINAIIVSDEQQNINIAILDGNGRVLQQMSKNVIVGTNTISITPNSNLSNGIKFIKFYGKNLNQTIAIVVQK